MAPGASPSAARYTAPSRGTAMGPGAGPPGERPLQGQPARLLGAVVVNHVLHDPGREVAQLDLDGAVTGRGVAVGAAVLLEVAGRFTGSGVPGLAAVRFQRPVQVAEGHLS